MASLNKFQGIGNLGHSPEVSYTPAGMAITKFSVAMTEKRKNKNSGEYEDFTEWAKVTTFGKVAENCGRFLDKGSSVYFEGKIQTSSYEKDGVKMYSTEIIANVVTFLGGKKQGGDQQQAQPKQQQQPQNPGYNQHPSYGGVQNYGQGQQGGGYQQGPPNDGSDLPF